MFAGLSVLRHRRFRSLWVGQTISQFGDASYYLLFLFYANKVTGSATVTGLVGAAGGLPFVFFGPFAGVLADRHDRRTIMLTCDLLSFAILVGVTFGFWFMKTPSVLAIVGATFLLSSVNAFFAPAKSASIPRLVPAEDLAAANGLSNSTTNLMFLVGLALATFGIGAFERIAPAFFMPLSAGVNALTFLVSTAFCLQVGSVKPQGNEENHFWTEFKEGLRAIVADPVLKLAIPLGGINNLVIAGFMIVYVEANRLWFGGTFLTLGLMEMSFVGTLAFFGMLAIKFPPRRPGLCFSLAWLSIGLFVLPMAFTRNFGVMLACNALCGVWLPFSWLGIDLYNQTTFPDTIGRISSAWSTVNQGVQPVGVALFGPIVAGCGISGTFLVIAGVITLLSVLTLFSKPFRRASAQHAAEPA